ncbi:hypothetical protein [Hydrogenophaga sp. BPS33]|uniref:hypothetical protein n=1 Tax=Hydrogenophaga sp. BPS33 TaxID=2651974 RepID=UPI00131FF961|nr:hypothetical protein [Hydrogenophaga sp. BPS33]QHE86315.1 hypothetical protein F9K07_16090 [Hydrogenophaga sp. BPS33]
MEHLQNLKTPELPSDPMIGEVHRLICERDRTVERLRNDLAQLEIEDTTDFLDLESPRAKERRAQRLRLNAELQQAVTSLEGAKAFLGRREGMAVYRSVRKLRQEIERDMEQATKISSEVGASLNTVLHHLLRLADVTGGVVEKLRGVRGRNTLTKDGHIAYSSIAEIAKPSQYTWWMARQIKTVLNWPENIPPGENFAISAHANFLQVGQSIQMLLGDDNFDPAVIAAVGAEDAASTEVAVVDQAGG